MSNNNAQKYRWDKWFKLKNTKTLYRGKDYFCLDHGMASQIRNQASKRKISVSVEIGEGYVTFKVGG